MSTSGQRRLTSSHNKLYRRVGLDLDTFFDIYPRHFSFATTAQIQEKLANSVLDPNLILKLVTRKNITGNIPGELSYILSSDSQPTGDVESRFAPYC